MADIKRTEFDTLVERVDKIDGRFSLLEESIQGLRAVVEHDAAERRVRDYRSELSHEIMSKKMRTFIGLCSIAVPAIYSIFEKILKK